MSLVLRACREFIPLTDSRLRRAPPLLRQWMVVSIFHQVVLSMGNGFGMSC